MEAGLKRKKKQLSFDQLESCSTEPKLFRTFYTVSSVQYLSVFFFFFGGGGKEERREVLTVCGLFHFSVYSQSCLSNRLSGLPSSWRLLAQV